MKLAIVTGASRGLGRAIAEELLNRIMRSSTSHGRRRPMPRSATSRSTYRIRQVRSTRSST